MTMFAPTNGEEWVRKTQKRLDLDARKGQAVAASETIAGKVRIATLAEAIAGLDDQSAVTPEGLRATIDAQFVPYRFSAGVATPPTTGAASLSNIFWNDPLAVTFPVGRFTVAPVVNVTVVDTVTADTIMVGVTVESVTTSGFRVRVNRLGAAPSSTYRVHWMAIQMTSGAAVG